MKKVFEGLVEEFEKRPNHVEEAFKIASERYHLTPYQINDISPAYARQLYSSIIQKFYQGKDHDNSRSWYENELRLFIWTLVCYLYLNGSGLEEMTQKDWELFSRTFPKKDPSLFQYQSQALLKTKIKVKDRLWESQQSQILKEIMLKNMKETEDSNSKVKWNEVSKDLYFISDKLFFRTAKQCRQRWLNHLDPSKKKGKWTANQCLTMFEHVKLYGKKWAELVEKLGRTRNQHTIKNKFNSLYKKQFKQKESENPRDEEIYDMIIARIKNAIHSNINQSPTEITFDIEDIPSSLGNHENQQKSSKKQIQPPPSQSFNFENFFRKIKNFKNQKQKSSTTIPPINSSTSLRLPEMNNLNVKEQNGEGEERTPAYLLDNPEINIFSKKDSESEEMQKESDQ